MLNLLKHNKEKILTLEYIENERRRRARGDRDRDGYRIEAYDPDAEAREAAAAAALPRARRGGAEVADGEDAGLQVGARKAGWQPVCFLVAWMGRGWGSRP